MVNIGRSRSIKRVTSGRGVATAFLLGLAPAWPRVGTTPDPRGTIFVERGCTACHAVWGLHLKSRSDVGPDLTFAVVDVRNRFGVQLEEFLRQPQGIMQMMLAAHLRLSAADRDSIGRVLRRTAWEHRAQLPKEVPPLIADSAGSP